jgi:flavin-dependent dehydrogenase
MSRQFDAVVIGSGLGGLTAGALYARAGNRVLVLERNHNFGGAATVYRHGLPSRRRSTRSTDSMARTRRCRSCDRLASIATSRSLTSAICTK